MKIGIKESRELKDRGYNIKHENYNKTNYLNKTIDLTDPFYDATKRYLVTQQKYVIPENYDVEQWLTAVYRDYAWE